MYTELQQLALLSSSIAASCLLLLHPNFEGLSVVAPKDPLQASCRNIIKYDFYPKEPAIRVEGKTETVRSLWTA